jgi:hypothetical protein
MKTWQVTSILVCALDVLLTACVPPPHEPTPVPTATLTTDVRITYPVDSVQVEREEMVRGTSQLIPEGYAIWIVVYPYVANRYYPQNDSAVIEAKGDWSSRTCIGVEADMGLKFDILAVLASKTAQDAFGAYLQTARDKEDWPGLEKLPKGATVYHRITVTRK